MGGFVDIVCRHFQNWPQRRAALDIKIDVLAEKADEIRRFVRDAAAFFGSGA
jgi:hypothetical protein